MSFDLNTDPLVKKYFFEKYPDVVKMLTDICDRHLFGTNYDKSDR